MERRFTALRVIGTIFKILAWIALILGILAAVAAFVSGLTLSNQTGVLGLNIGGPLVGVATFIVALVIAIINFMLLYAIGDTIFLFLSVEENTRRTAYVMQQQYMARQPAYGPPAAPRTYED
jgi:hypothetical protein